ncbi:MAG TPA: alpha/beta hydrolase [Ornithinimicrobium sp.]|uniref:alpha/beta fold hydrolase n=1 Tax=Ornithinimicrobium sp. TaxID=1977084 RepID=UPI002B47AE4C|nr:alpha/beta hydrolase [Ornithinimicrobium sp.]HKJ11572.1 alpha/beta hydrolase [Ornithinimicrobium sp.]
METEEHGPFPPGAFASLLGARVHWVDFGGPSEPGAPLCVLVHGLGGSTVNWESVVPHLLGRFRCVALDLAGFGRTDPGPRRGTVEDNTALLASFVSMVTADSLSRTVVLVGNSMGGLICARYACSVAPPGDVGAASARPAIAGVVLLDPTVPPARLVPGPGGVLAAGLYAVPAVGRAAARARRSWRTPEQNVGDTLRLCTVDPARVDPDVVARHLPVARRRVTHPEMDRFYSDAARSILWHLAHRWATDATYASLTMPVLLVHGTRDRLVPFSGAVRIAGQNPGWRFVPAADCGHLPMLEHPRWLAGHMHRWWSDIAGDAGSVPVVD